MNRTLDSISRISHTNLKGKERRGRTERCNWSFRFLLLLDMKVSELKLLFYCDIQHKPPRKIMTLKSGQIPDFKMSRYPKMPDILPFPSRNWAKRRVQCLWCRFENHKNKTPHFKSEIRIHRFLYTNISINSSSPIFLFWLFLQFYNNFRTENFSSFSTNAFS